MTESEKMGDFVLYDLASRYPLHLYLLFTSKTLETITQSYLSGYACRGLTIALSSKTCGSVVKAISGSKQNQFLQILSPFHRANAEAEPRYERKPQDSKKPAWIQ